MRVLCTCVPGYGHFHPMVPLAQALRTAGHEVAFSTAARFCRRVVEPAGFHSFPAGLSPHVAFERALELDGRAEAEAVDTMDVWRFGARMFAEVAAPAKVPDLVRAIRDWDADLVVHDMTDFAGPVAAAACGIPWANHSFGALQPEEFWTAAAEAVAPTWAAEDVEPGPLGGMFRWLYLDVCPPGFQAPAIGAVATARPLRPVPFDNPSGAALPSWVEDLPSPLVYVTLGTVANHTPHVFETAVAGLAELPVSLIVTVGPDRDPAELGPLPANVHVEPYLPQSLLFPSCALVVCHGGSGTTLAALAAGLPLLVLPQEANQLWNADRIAALGAGEQVRRSDLTVEAVRNGARRLLDDQRYRGEAQRLAAEIAAMPAPGSLVAPLEDLAKRRPLDRGRRRRIGIGSIPSADDGGWR